MNFDEFKHEIVTRCKAESACEPQFKRILSSETFPEIFTVLKDNFSWSCNHKIIEGEILTAVKTEAAQSEIYVNESVSTGFLLASGRATVRAWDSATVEAWDSATVEASGSATVRASGRATVRASGSATVEASGSATVEAWGSATVEAWGSSFISSYKNIECKLSDHAIFRNTETKEITIVENSYTIITRAAEAPTPDSI